MESDHNLLVRLVYSYIISEVMMTVFSIIS